MSVNHCRSDTILNSLLHMPFESYKWSGGWWNLVGVPTLWHLESFHLTSVCVCVSVCVRERRKIELTARGEKNPILLDGVRACTSGMRTHRASDYTTSAGTPRISSNKHLEHSPTMCYLSSTAGYGSHDGMSVHFILHIFGINAALVAPADLVSATAWRGSW